MIVSIASRWDLRPIFSIPTSTLTGKFVWSCLILNTGFLQLRSLKVSIYCTPETFLEGLKTFFYSVLEAISDLLEQPDSDDPFVPEIASLHKNNLKEFNRLAKKYTKRYAIEEGKKVKKPKAKKSKPTP